MPIVPDFAFPFEHQQKVAITNPTVSCLGLTKREYFAAMALQGVLSNPQTDLRQFSDGQQRQILLQTVALIADDMMQALYPPIPEA
jgi:hypothetical protein